MTMETDVPQIPSFPDLPILDPEERARTLMEHGIELAESGRHDEAAAELERAAAMAQSTGRSGQLITVTINQGYAASLRDDHEGAVGFLEAAAAAARDAGDARKQAIALANLSVEFGELGRFDEKIGTLSDYLELLPENEAAARVDALVEQALAFLELDDPGSALLDLEAADAAASQSGDSFLAYTVRMTQCDAYLRSGDPMAAMILYQQAAGFARQAGSGEGLVRALIGMAHTERTLGRTDDAIAHFTQIERSCRESGDREALAGALYWHGDCLRSMRQKRAALERWREAETIRRELDQPGQLADCLFAQADVLRTLGDHASADPLFREAIDLYEAEGIGAARANAAYRHGSSLWATGSYEEALSRATEAVELGARYGDASVERRAHGLQAMALADLDRTGEAYEALDAAEALCAQAEANSTMVWMLARRAYVMARENRPAEEVIAQLRKAHYHALAKNEYRASRSAIRRIASYIVDRCDESYHEPLLEFRTQWLDELDRMLEGESPAGAVAPEASIEPIVENTDDEDEETIDE